MPFWNSDTIKHKAAQSKLVEPWSNDRVKQCAYELSLGPEVYVTSSALAQKKRLEVGDEVTIPPGQFALLLTEEIVSIPSDTIAFMSIKAGVKFRGLVNVSGFHVDPGFSGRLKFSVYNAGCMDLVLLRGDALFPIWFAALDGPTPDPYRGSHQGQKEITSQDIMNLQGVMVSPAALSESLRALRERHEKLSENSSKVNSELHSAFEKAKSAKDMSAWVLGAFIAILVALVGLAVTLGVLIGEMKGNITSSSDAIKELRQSIVSMETSARTERRTSKEGGPVEGSSSAPAKPETAKTPSRKPERSKVQGQGR